MSQALSHRDCYLKSLCRNFYAARPFIIPKKPLLVVAHRTSLVPLGAATRWIASPHIEKSTHPALLRETFRLRHGNLVKDGSLAHARLLFAVGLDGDH